MFDMYFSYCGAACNARFDISTGMMAKVMMSTATAALLSIIRHDEDDEALFAAPVVDARQPGEAGAFRYFTTAFIARQRSSPMIERYDIAFLFD